MAVDDLIKLKDGTLIDTTTGKSTISTEINKAFADDRPANKGKNEFINGRRRFLDDLPMPFLRSKPVAIVASYAMFGLTNGDISRILGIHVDEIVAVQESADYAVYMEGVLQNVREHDSNVVRKKLNKAAERASQKIVDLTDSDNDKVALAASQDVLNRTGHKPADVHEHRIDGGFTIRVIKDTKTISDIEGV